MICSRCKKDNSSSKSKTCDRCKEYGRLWKKNNNGRIRNYYQKNKDLIKARSKKRYRENRSELLDQMKDRWNKKPPLERWAIKSINSHKRKHITVEVTVQELVNLASKALHCWLCKKELKHQNLIDDPSHNNWLTVDRIDNERGLHPDNIHIICLQCNSRKRTMSLRRFAQLVQPSH